MARTAGRRSNELSFVSKTLIVFGVGSLVFVAWQLRALIIMVFAAIVVATVFRAIARLISDHTPLSDTGAISAAIFIVFAMLGTVGFLFGSEIGQQVQTLSQSLPAAMAQLERLLARWGLAEEVRGWLSAPSPGGGSVVSSILRFLVSLSGGIADTLVVIFGGIFLALQPRLYRTGLVKLVPRRRRELVSQAMDDSENALQLWLKAQLVSMAVVGAFTTLGLWLIGVPSWLVLGLIAFTLEFIPFAGPVVAAVPAILIALAVSPELALWTLGLYVLVQQLEGNVVYPLVQQWAVRIPAALLLFSLLAFGTLFGAVGVIFAAPLTVVTYVLVKRLYVKEALETETPIPGEDDD